MARKGTKTLKRREALALMGAGTVMAAVRPAAAAVEVQGGNACNKPAEVGTYRRSGMQAVVSFSCCEETLNALLVGVEEPKRAPKPRGKTHLKPLRDRLVTDNLEEYCFMIWGLKEEQARSLYDSIPKQVGMEPDKRVSPK
jgi:hypothetical protein